jgi:hypothetical protein
VVSAAFALAVATRPDTLTSRGEARAREPIFKKLRLLSVEHLRVITPPLIRDQCMSLSIHCAPGGGNGAFRLLPEMVFNKRIDKDIYKYQIIEAPFFFIGEPCIFIDIPCKQTLKFRLAFSIPIRYFSI